MAQRFLLYVCLTLFLTACATQSYNHQSSQSFPIRERAQTQTEGGISVSASVPGKNEAEAIFGVPLYKRGIQPVWLEIVNQSPNRIRFAPISLDRYYFAPLEVAYMFRKGYNKEARAEMDRYFDSSAMPRQIPAGETRSGFVLTHADPGTKSFNVDLFSAKEDHSFTFFITVPGFKPDHADVDFDALYSESEKANYDLDGLRTALMDSAWKTTDRTGTKTGLPINLVIVGDGLAVLQSLLRAGWAESPSVKDSDQLENAQYFRGRKPDAVFRIQRDRKRDRNELYLWLTPMQLEGEAVWKAQTRHFIGQKTELEQAFFGTQIDPDLNDGRGYLIQNMWYSQNLERLGWLKVGEWVPIEESRRDFNGSEYFSDGHVSVIWLSEDPVSLIETQRVDWDQTPYSQ